MGKTIFSRGHIEATYNDREQTDKGRKYYDICYGWICPEPQSIEHVVLAVEANRGFFDGNLHPCEKLLASKYPIPRNIRDSLSSMIKSRHRSGQVLRMQLDPKYASTVKGEKRPFTPAQTDSRALNIAMICSHFRDLERSGDVAKFGKMACYSIVGEKVGLAAATVGDLVREERKGKI